MCSSGVCHVVDVLNALCVSLSIIIIIGSIAENTHVHVNTTFMTLVFLIIIEVNTSQDLLLNLNLCFNDQ